MGWRVSPSGSRRPLWVGGADTGRPEGAVSALRVRVGLCGPVRNRQSRDNACVSPSGSRRPLRASIPLPIALPLSVSALRVRVGLCGLEQARCGSIYPLVSALRVRVGLCGSGIRVASGLPVRVSALRVRVGLCGAPCSDGWRGPRKCQPFGFASASAGHIRSRRSHRYHSCQPFGFASASAGCAWLDHRVTSPSVSPSGSRRPLRVLGGRTLVVLAEVSALRVRVGLCGERRSWWQMMGWRVSPSGSRRPLRGQADTRDCAGHGVSALRVRVGLCGVSGTALETSRCSCQPFGFASASAGRGAGSALRRPRRVSPSGSRRPLRGLRRRLRFHHLPVSALRVRVGLCGQPGPCRTLSCPLCQPFGFASASAGFPRYIGRCSNIRVSPSGSRRPLRGGGPS